ncbi:MAG: hypothetical protein JKY27_11415 [Magnetovibrio sp.]|nr:hypothetical protein [Magnetovibrio sp.]
MNLTFNMLSEGRRWSERHLLDFCITFYSRNMNCALSHKAGIIFAVITAIIVVSTDSARADDVDELMLGTFYEDVMSTFEVRQSVEIPPSHKAMIIQPAEFGNQTLLIFEEGALVSKTLSGHRWDVVEPLDLDGVPGLVASKWSGGAHCCFTYNIVALKPTPKIIQILELHDSPGKLAPCGDNVCLHIIDFTFASWRGAFANSISASVVMSLHAKRFYFDPELMSKPDAVVTDQAVREIRKTVERAKQKTDVDTAYQMLGQELLRLIYAGRADKAEKLLRLVWPHKQDAVSKQAFIHEFIDRLMGSPYWNDLVLLNGGSILGTKK